MYVPLHQFFVLIGIEWNAVSHLSDYADP